jgi:hypothetical protein
MASQPRGRERIDGVAALALLPATIERRARLHRDAVVVIGLLLVGAVAWALFALSWRPLIALALVPPLVALHLWRDARAVEHWRGPIVDAWADEGMEFGAYVSTVRANKAIPAQTLDGMLASLPPASLDESTRRAPAVRDGVRVVAEIAAARARDHALLVGLARSAAVIVAAVAIATGSLVPLAAIALALLFFLGERAVDARRLARWRAWVERSRSGGLEAARLRVAIEDLPLGALPARMRAALLGALD